MKIAIAGAFGFVGRNLIQHILDFTDHEVIAISRSSRMSDNPRVTCVRADLHSLKEITAALKGSDVAIYLVHSMAPSSRLSQGHFRDFDFILADNFGRASNSCDIKQIIYVGGMIPCDRTLSIHLESRLEVEEVLKSHSIPVSALRCGLVLGPKSSSFSIIVRLTNRLPLMVLPKWMRTKSNPVYVVDLAKIVVACAENPEGGHRVIDVGMDQRVSYKEIVVATAKELGKKPILIDAPYFSPHISKLWVRMVSGAPKSLVYPLINSVRHEMLKSPENSWPDSWGITPRNLKDSVKETFTSPFVFEIPRLLSSIRQQSEVRSVQRMHLPEKSSVPDVVNMYFTWLPWYLKPFLKISRKNLVCEYRTRFFSILLLVLERDRQSSKKNRELFHVKSGLLVAKHNRGRFEFRASPDREFLIAALHNYKPSLPWFVYRLSQALVHRLVMKSFSRSLKAYSDV